MDGISHRENLPIRNFTVYVQTASPKVHGKSAEPIITVWFIYSRGVKHKHHRNSLSGPQALPAPPSAALNSAEVSLVKGMYDN